MLKLVYCPQPAGCSQAELVSRVRTSDGPEQVEVVGRSTGFVGLLDHALHVCRTRGSFRRKFLLAPVDLDFVLR
jgi:hypothetical protein